MHPHRAAGGTNRQYKTSASSYGGYTCLCYSTCMVSLSARRASRSTNLEREICIMSTSNAGSARTSESQAMRPTLDPAPLAAWRASTHDMAPNFVCELIDDFLNDATTQLATLEHASTTGDTATCKFVAHRMLSSCNAIGACQLALYFEEMELLAKNGAVLFLGSQFAKIKAEFDRLEPALEQERCA